ncbi:MAG: PorT family protein [Bacteroidia bacterium]|nr:PorT family protein [Bacteroidia bacterium]
MRRSLHITGLLLLLWLAGGNLFSQMSPERNLRTLNEDMRAGKFEKVITDFKLFFEGDYKQLREKGTTKLSQDAKDVLEEALEIMATAYLELDSMPQAGQAMYFLLKNNNYYRPSDSKTQSFLRLYRKYYLFPRWSIGFHFMGSLTSVDASKSSQLRFDSDSLREKYSPQPGLGFGLRAEHNFTRSFGLGTELNYSRVAYSYHAKVDQPAISTQDWEMKYQENSIYLTLPLYAKFKWILPQSRKKSFRPAVQTSIVAYGGGQTSYLLKSSANVSFHETTNVSGEEPYSVSTEKSNLTANRNRWDYGLVGGVGMDFDLGNSSFGDITLFFRTRNQFYFNNHVKLGNSPNAVLLWDYNYLEHSLHLRHYFILMAGMKVNLKKQIKKGRS